MPPSQGGRRGFDPHRPLQSRQGFLEIFDLGFCITLRPPYASLPAYKRRIQGV